MQARHLLLGAVAVLVTACIQDPESPMNLPDVPKLAVDETSVTRVSMVVNATLGGTADVTEYGVEVSETLFEAGGSYKVLALQRGEGNEYSAGVSDLKSNTTYFLRAFISNGHSKMYSDILTQKTPETSVASVSDVTIKDNYYLVATIEDNGGRGVEDVGFMWGTSNERKSIKREKRYPGTLSEDGKTFTLPLSEVGYGTHYLMAYVEDDKDGTGYSRIPYEFSLKDEDGVEIEDPNFKKYLLLYHDPNEDGKLTYAELKQIEFIDVRTDNIKSVREIEMMPLTSLMVSGSQQGSGQLTSLNVKKDSLLHMMDCSNNQIAELDVSANILLDMLYCQGNKIKTLNASMIPELRYLNCERNPMETLYLSWYQKFDELLYPEGCQIIYVDKPDEPIQEGQPNNEIWYTTTDGSMIDPNEGASFGEGVTLVSNTYENGKGVLKFDRDVTMIGEYAFFNKSTLAGFIAPPSVQVIGRDAFFKCVSMLDISLPEGLVRISEHAFDHCESLVDVTIPESVEVIDMSPFVYCTSLQHFYGKFADSTHRCLIWEDDLLAVATAGLSSFTVPAGVTNIVEEAFAGMSQLTEIILPEGLKTIGWYVFEGCSSLRHIVIPSSVESIGENALAACKGLEDITVEPINPPAGGQGMFGGTFCPIYVHAESLAAYKSAQYWSEYADRIQAIPGEISPSKYLTFTSEGTTKVALDSEGYSPVLYYSFDATNWTQWDFSELTFSSGNPLYICGSNSLGLYPDSEVDTHNTFTATGDHFSISGDIMSLLNKDEDLTSIPARAQGLANTNACFYALFRDCTLLTSGPSLPATGLMAYCYQNMFAGCTGLTEAPALPAAVLSAGCYANMFEGCTSLTAAPALPATTLAKDCYNKMFSGCSGLTSAPALPATTMEEYCYYSMFESCTSLVAAPELPATSLARFCYDNMFLKCSELSSAPELPAETLVQGCYAYMFAECGKLSFVKCLATSISAADCTTCWLAEVASAGVFVKSANVTWSSGISGIPEGWTVQNEGDVPNGGNEGTGEDEWN